MVAFHTTVQRHRSVLGLLVDPVELRGLVADKILVLEPQGDLLLGALDAVGPVADVAADYLQHAGQRSVLPWRRCLLRFGGLPSMAKSPRIVPGAEARGFVAPRRAGSDAISDKLS